MKVLYIGHYREGTGWSKAAQDLILSINRSGVDVVCRNIKLTNTNVAIDPMVSILEQKNLENIDYCIQHVLPHHMVGTDKFKKNIAYFVGESSSVKYSGWMNNLSYMDEIWVPNETMKNNLILDGFYKPIKIVHHAFDLSKYDNINAQINFGSENYKYKFYYIGELNDRKNLDTIIRCFHAEFQPWEPVCLILKVKRFGVHSHELKKHVHSMCDQIKKEMRLYKNLDQYHNEIIITEDMTDEQIMILHSSCDCFVSPSHGEGWSIPAFDAMCFGKTPICSDEGGPAEFIDKDNLSTGCRISGTETICNHSDAAFPTIFTGREFWFTPNEKEIRKAMRYYYKNKEVSHKEKALEHAEKFSYQNIGNQIKEALNVK